MSLGPSLSAENSHCRLDLVSWTGPLCCIMPGVEEVGPGMLVCWLLGLFVYLLQTLSLAGALNQHWAQGRKG